MVLRYGAGRSFSGLGETLPSTLRVAKAGVVCPVLAAGDIVGIAFQRRRAEGLELLVKI